MKNPFASFFHSVLEHFRRPHGVPAEPALSPEQFRELLIETLDDPATARLLARTLLGPAFPIQGGERDPAAADVSSGNFGTGFDPDDTGDYNFPNSKVGIGTSSPWSKLQVRDATDNSGTSINSYAGGLDITNAQTVSGTYALLRFASFDGSSLGASDGSYIQSLNGGNNVIHLAFGRFLSNATSTEYMRIQSGGNVGIGTAAPGYVLDVKARSAVGDETFTGTGLDDMDSGGTFIGASSLNYKVQIDGTGTPNTFKWSDDGGSTWDATGVPITGGAQTLNNGVTVTFGSTAGHTLGDYWTFSTSVTNGLSVQDAAGTRSLRMGNDGKLHIKAGSTGIGLLIEADDTKGRIGFLETGGTDAANVIYRDSADITILRNFNQDYTILKIWAPPNAVGNNREATLTLARGDSNEEYMDVYNNDLPPENCTNVNESSPRV